MQGILYNYSYIYVPFVYNMTPCSVLRACLFCCSTLNKLINIIIIIIIIIIKVIVMCFILLNKLNEYYQEDIILLKWQKYIEQSVRTLYEMLLWTGNILTTGDTKCVM